MDREREQLKRFPVHATPEDDEEATLHWNNKMCVAPSARSISVRSPSRNKDVPGSRAKSKANRPRWPRIKFAAATADVGWVKNAKCPDPPVMSALSLIRMQSSVIAKAATEYRAGPAG